MNMRQLTLKILWLGVLCTGLASVPAFSQGLGTLVELARKNDPQWLLANAKFRESQEYLPQAYSQLLPSVSFTSNTNKVQQQLTNGATENPEQRYPSSSKVLSLRQPIFRSKQMFSVNSAKAQTEQAAFYFQEETQQVTLRVVDAYLNLLLANDRKVFLESQKELVNTRLKAAMAGLRAGQGMRTDVDEAQAELSKIVADEIQVNQSILVSKMQMELLIGTSVSSLYPLNLNKFKTYAFTHLTTEQLFEQAIQNNPKLKAQKLDVEIAQAMIKQAEAGHHPTLDLTAQVNQTTGESSYFVSTRNNSRVVGLQLNVPIYSGGLINSQVRQALSKLEQAQEQISFASNNLRVQIHKESSALKEGIKRVEAFEVAVASAKQAVISNQKGVLAGTRTEFDVMKNLNQLTQVQLDLTRSRYELISAWFRLKSYLGSVDNQFVDELSSIFSP
jgi:TolC family type I secretion outer membrane protein